MAQSKMQCKPWRSRRWRTPARSRLDAYRTIEGLIAALDKKLSDQMNLGIPSRGSSRTGRTWRGPGIWSTTRPGRNAQDSRHEHFPKRPAQDDASLGHWGDQSPIFKKLYEEEWPGWWRMAETGR